MLKHLHVTLNDGYVSEPELLSEQVFEIAFMAAGNGIVFDNLGPVDGAERVLVLRNEHDAKQLMDLAESIDDTVPHPDAYFHIWSLVDPASGRAVVLPIKVDSSWD